jgi:uncharacterized protein (DUF58 family)
MLGEHGRRRAGMGDEFWQYRPALPGDEARSIDWRRSGQADASFVREKEWQAAQSVLFWVDQAQSLNFSSSKDLPQKAEVARALALASMVLLTRAGERIGLTDLSLPARSGEMQLVRLGEALVRGDAADYGAPDVSGMTPNSRAVFISDFLTDPAPLERALTEAADRGVKGVLLQVLDPQEEAFPFDGRTIFESVGKSVVHETLKARDLRDRYLERLAERKAMLSDLAQVTGWQYGCHHTDKPMSAALLWLYQALERVH